MELENQINVYKLAGAAPALKEALSSPEVNVEDPYFGGQKAFSIFLQTMETAIPFPYVGVWSDIDDAFTNAMQQIALAELSVQEALDQAAATAQEALDQ